MNFIFRIVAEISLTKMWRERKRDIYKENINRRMPFSISRCNKPLSIDIQNINHLSRINAEKSVAKNYSRKKEKRERKDNTYKTEQTGQRRLAIPRYNLSLLFCILNFLSYILVKISLTKYLER